MHTFYIICTHIRLDVKISELIDDVKVRFKIEKKRQERVI